MAEGVKNMMTLIYDLTKVLYILENTGVETICLIYPGHRGSNTGKCDHVGMEHNKYNGIS